jgi:hypothetical protein
VRGGIEDSVESDVGIHVCTHIGVGGNCIERTIMPDLINPDFNDGKKTHVVWRDEKCASCLNVGNCPLIQIIYQHTIMTHSGIHVAHCDSYSADVNSEYYIPSDADMSEIARVNAEALQQQVDLLNDVLKEVTSGVNI